MYDLTLAGVQTLSGLSRQTLLQYLHLKQLDCEGMQRLKSWACVSTVLQDSANVTSEFWRPPVRTSLY